MSIIGTGQLQRRQAIGSFDALARQEQQQNFTNDQLEQAQKNQHKQDVGNIAGMATSYGVNHALNLQAGQTALSHGLATESAADMAAAPAISDVAASGATDAAITGATTDAALAGGTAAGAGTAAAGTAAAGTAAAGTTAAVGAGAGAAGAAPVAAALGPVGWAVAGGLLAYSLFS